MTNRIAIVLGAILVVITVLDLLLFGSDHLIFVSKKMVELIDWMAFWR